LFYNQKTETKDTETKDTETKDTETETKTKTKKKFRQSNPQEIATNMNTFGKTWPNGKPWPNWTGKMFYDSSSKTMSPEVRCAIGVSEYETKLQGDSLFTKSTGFYDDLDQDAFCNCYEIKPNDTVDANGSMIPADETLKILKGIRDEAGVVCKTKDGFEDPRFGRRRSHICESLGTC